MQSSARNSRKVNATADAAAAPEVATESGLRRFGRTVVVPWWREVRSTEDRLFRFFVVVSALFHFGVVAVQGVSFWLTRKTLLEEWTMDADLLPDLESGAPLKSALPDAKPADDPKVSDRILPQLTKKFAIDEKPPEEKTFEEKSDTKPVAKDEKKVEQQPEKSTTMARQDEDEQNRLKKDEALKRLALESLRQQNKVDKEAKAETAGDPKLADKSSASAKDINTGAVMGIPNRSAFSRYRSLLAAAVRRNYVLPEAYNFKSANIRVAFTIVVTESGQLADLKVEESSGDQVFDDLTLQAVKSSVPFPPPPADLAGQAITIQFTPGSM